MTTMGIVVVSVACIWSIAAVAMVGGLFICDYASSAQVFITKTFMGLSIVLICAIGAAAITEPKKRKSVTVAPNVCRCECIGGVPFVREVKSAATVD